MKDLFEKCHNTEQLDFVRENNLYPYFHELQSKQDTIVNMEGKKIYMFGSNNYLGLTSDKRVIKAAIDATEFYGTGVSGSRFLNGTLDLHLKLEKELASFLDKEACTLFSTGFQSNLGIISSICGRNDIIFSDKENHASIYDGIKLSGAKMVRFNHNDMEDLENKLKEAPENVGKLIVTDGVFSMTGDIANVPKLVELKKKYGARLMIDDAHGFGTVGPNGKGTAHIFNLQDDVDLIMGTFSKSLASIGGYCVGDYKVIDYMRHNSRPYIFSAAIPPANTASALAALRVLKEEPQRVIHLQDMADYMKKRLSSKGIKIIHSNTPVVPVYTYKTLWTFAVCNKLFERGIYVNPVIPPATPYGECLIRVSLMATHTKEIIDEACDIIEQTLKDTPEIPNDF